MNSIHKLLLNIFSIPSGKFIHWFFCIVSTEKYVAYINKGGIVIMSIFIYLVFKLIVQLSFFIYCILNGFLWIYAVMILMNILQ